jgi:hypothetical protein
VVVASLGQAGVAGDQWHAERLAQGHEGGVVGGEVVTELPHPVCQHGVLVPDDGQVGEVGASVGRPVIAQLSGADEPTECMEELDVEQMGGMQVAVDAQPVHQLPIPRSADQDANDRRCVDDEHR